jgi:two-component system, sensor histidine kinase
VMVTRFTHVLHDSFKKSTRLRLENADLVEALRAEKAAAVEANLAKSRFLAAASHDLRQPMHALSLLIASYPSAKLPAEEAEIIATMRRSADAMASLFDALLDVSRLDAGTVEPRPEAIDVTQFGTRLYREFTPLAREHGLALRLRTANAVVLADPMLLNRIVSNLIVNALRHGAREGALLAFRPRAGALAIEVWDTGVGIAPEHQKAIFGEFFQVGNPERDRQKGLGLGLAIVDRLVKLMGLSLELRSKPGVGSMFRVLVPLAPAGTVLRPASGIGEALREHAQLAPVSFNLSVIVVDDERDVREAMSLLLTSWGCQVLAISSADDTAALGAQSGFAPDLIVADLRLRGDETGISAVRALRARFGREVPAVIVSGDTLPARLQEVQESGLPMLHKPLRPEALREVLRGLTQNAFVVPAEAGTQCSSGFPPSRE